MPPPDSVPIPKIPQEFRVRVMLDYDAWKRYPEYVNAQKRDARRKAALALYKYFGPEPVKVTVTEKESRVSYFEIEFEIRAVLE